MSHKILRPFIVKVSVLSVHFPLPTCRCNLHISALTEMCTYTCVCIHT